MIDRRTFFLAALSLAATAGTALPTAAQAHGYKLGNLEIGHPWSRATAATAPTAAAYMKITNNGAAVDRLVAAKSDAADKVEVHEMKMEGSIMRMRELEKGLEIPAGATVTLEPGGFHLMLIGLKAPLQQGTRVPVTLVFEKAGSIDIELAVAAMGATPGQSAPGHKMH